MKTDRTGWHSEHEQRMGLADQDAAIDAYLDGLLRDPDSASYWSADASLADLDDNEHNEGYSEQTTDDIQQVKRAVGLSLGALSKFKVGINEKPILVEKTEINHRDEKRIESVVSIENHLGLASDETATDALSPEKPATASIELSKDATARFPGARAPVDVVTPVKTESAWRVFAIGQLKVALPSVEIFDIMEDSSLRPISGAPASVAGVIHYQDRPRMILSLDAWLPKVAGDAQIILLGAQGLWGVRVGTEVADLTWDEAQTRWRDSSERHASRPWLAGVNRAAGLAFLNVEFLRSALNARG